MGVRKFNLYMNFKASWSQNSLIKQIFSICHTDYNDIIQSLDSVNISEQLIDDLIAYLSPYSSVHSSLFTDSINLIENNYMKRTAIL